MRFSAGLQSPGECEEAGNGLARGWGEVRAGKVFCGSAQDRQRAHAYIDERAPLGSQHCGKAEVRIHWVRREKTNHKPMVMNCKPIP